VPNLGFGFADDDDDRQERLVARIVGAALVLSGVYLLLTPDG
jgi:hypothetical protein